jgi:hypothetical protein
MSDDSKTGGTRPPAPDRGGSQRHLSPEDDASIVKNPNNSAFDADEANRLRQKQG